MIAILSATEEVNYSMPLPLAVYSWAMIGVHSIVFVPKERGPKLELAIQYCDLAATYYPFECEEKRIPTYSQVSRLFAAAIPGIEDQDILITGDSDMAVFSSYFEEAPDNCIIGADLTPADQVPMCYVKMTAANWKKAMGINKTYQQHVAELIDPIEGLNIRGEQWAFDQWFCKKKLDESGIQLELINRASPGTQFATRRADRDGWHFNVDEIIDAHLPRPLTDQTNFDKVYNLFRHKYPTANLQWMTEFRDQYLKLL